MQALNRLCAGVCAGLCDLCSLCLSCADLRPPCLGPVLSFPVLRLFYPVLFCPVSPLP